MGIFRLLLAISVLINHSSSILGTSLVGGRIAVQSFFIISGFYMSLVLNEKYSKRKNAYTLFITNRILRLYPIYWFVMVITIVYGATIYIYSHGIYGGPLQKYVDYFDSMSLESFLFLIITNLTLIGQDVVMFLGFNTSTGSFFFTENFNLSNPKLYQFLLVPQAWTIAVELLFYLMAPFIVTKKWPLPAFLLIISLFLRIYFYRLGLNFDPWTYRFFPTEIFFFMLGYFSYQFYVYLKKETIKQSILTSIFFLVVFATVFFPFLPGDSSKEVLFFFLTSISLPFLFILTKNSKWDNLIGDLCYPVYISHTLILMLIEKRQLANSIGMSYSLLTITIIFSFFLNKFIAERIEKFRKQRVEILQENKK